jgi:hypothetical protein
LFAVVVAETRECMKNAASLSEHPDIEAFGYAYSPLKGLIMS